VGKSHEPGIYKQGSPVQMKEVLNQHSGMHNLNLTGGAVKSDEKQLKLHKTGKAHFIDCWSETRLGNNGYAL
jgi:hypothetical protein